MNQNKQGFLNTIPPVTKNLIFINIICFVACFIFSQKGINLVNFGALYSIQSGHFHPYQLFTCMFLHGSLAHIFLNMYALWLFGRSLEIIWGPRRFLLFYFVTGLGAGLFQLLIITIRLHYIKVGLSPDMISAIFDKGVGLLDNNMNYIDPTMGALSLKVFSLINTSVIGASGAIFGILLAFGMQFPNAEFFIIPIPIPIKAKFLVIIFGAVELGLGIANLTGDPIAHFAHLGGLFTGLILILCWRWTHKKKLDDRLQS